MEKKRISFKANGKVVSFLAKAKGKIKLRPGRAGKIARSTKKSIRVKKVKLKRVNVAKRVQAATNRLDRIRNVFDNNVHTKYIADDADHMIKRLRNTVTFDRVGKKGTLVAVPKADYHYEIKNITRHEKGLISRAAKDALRRAKEYQFEASYRAKDIGKPGAVDATGVAMMRAQGDALETWSNQLKAGKLVKQPDLEKVGAAIADKEFRENYWRQESMAAAARIAARKAKKIAIPRHHAPKS